MVRYRLDYQLLHPLKSISLDHMIMITILNFENNGLIGDLVSFLAGPQPHDVISYLSLPEGL